MSAKCLTIPLACSTALITLVGSTPGRSVLEEIRVYDTAPDLRVVFDLDRLALIEIDDTELLSGHVLVHLRDTSLGFAWESAPDDVRGVAEILNPTPSVGESLTIRVDAGQPLADTQHFVLRGVSDLVLNLEPQAGLLPPISAAAPPVSAETMSPTGSDPLAQITLAISQGQPAPLEWSAASMETGIAAAAQVSSGEGTADFLDLSLDLFVEGGTAEGLNLPADWMISSLVDPPDGAEAPSRAASQVQWLTGLDDLGERMSGTLDRLEEARRFYSPMSLGRHALADEYATTPADMENLPQEIAGDYRDAVLTRRRERAISLLRHWIATHPDSLWNQRMLFLIGEQRYLLAHDDVSDSLLTRRVPDWLGPINDFRLALRHEPNSQWAPLAWLRICECYRQLGWTQDALATLESFQRAGTEYSVGTILMLRARLLHELGREAEEIAVLAEHLEIDPDGPRVASAYLRLGEIHHDQGRRLSAYNALHESWERDPDLIRRDPAAATKVIETALDNADDRWALELIDHVLRSFPGRPENAEVAGLLGRLHRERDEIDQALYVYSRMLDRYGTGPRTLTALMHLADQGRRDKMDGTQREGFTEPAYLDPRWAYEVVINQWPDEDIAQVAYLHLGELLVEESQPLAALEHLNRLLVERPDTEIRPIVEDVLADALDVALRDSLGKDDPIDAVQFYCDSLRQSGELDIAPDVIWGLAQAYAELGLWGETANLTSRLLALWDAPQAPELPWTDVLARNVESLERMGHLDEALLTLERGLEAMPSGESHVDLAHARTRVLHGMGRWEDTLAAGETFLALGGTPLQRLSVMFLRADATRNAAGPEVAIPLYVDALEAFQETGRRRLTSAVPYGIAFQLADCFYQTGNWDHARRVYEELRDVYTDTDETVICQWRIAQCLARSGRFEEARAEVEQISTAAPGTLWTNLGDETMRDFEWLELYPSYFSQGGVL